MTDRWNSVEELYHQAREMDETSRTEFLDQQCGEDKSLREEVESLLASGKEAKQLFESPAIVRLGKLIASEMPAVKSGDDLIGQVVSHYHVIEKLGSGGMGVVYKAEDTRLHRFVALKFLPNDLARDPQWLSRFQREAQAASALNHPNISTIHDIGEHEGNAFIVMEFLEGETLKQLISSTQLKTEEMVDLGIQIADALEAAHANGIIHRDVKPANIFVSKRWHAKLLDFGVAKVTRQSAGTHRISAGVGTPALEEDLTQTGVALGTTAYMSPEQVRGEELDARTDLFSLGVVLYELACGVRPFKGNTSGATSAAILHDLPESPLRLNPMLPLRFAEIITRTLEKNRDLRHPRAADLATDLRRARRDLEFRDGAAVGAEPPSTRFWQRGSFARSLGARIGAVTLVGAVIAGAGIFYHSHRVKAPLTELDTVVLADFSNQAGDPVFSDALKQAFAVELGQSPFLNLMSDRKVNETLRMMGRSSGDRISEDVGWDICRRNGAKALLGGDISRLGSVYLITLNAVACSTGENLAREQAEATTKESVLKALSQASSKLRTKLGESLPSVQQYETPVEATTSSLEALQNYSQGMKVRKEKGPVASMPFFNRAIELDPNFPMAYAALSAAYEATRQPSLAMEYIAKAYQLRDRATKREKLRISATYFGTRQEMDQAILAHQDWTANYPRDPVPHLNLGVTFARTGQHERALTEIKQALELDPDDRLYYADLLFTYLTLNRFDEAKAIFDRALGRGLESGDLHEQMYALAFVRGDRKAMDQQLAWFAGRPGEEDELLSMQSDTEAFYGRMQKARDYSRKAADSALRAGNKESAALWEVNAALREAEIGETTAARKGATSAMLLSQGQDVNIVAALALARIGDPRAETLAAELAKEYPTNTLLKLYWLPTIHAALEVRRGDSAKALVQLDDAKPYELGITATFVNYLYPAYVRGQAFLLAGDGQAAATEFLKLLDHPGLMENFITGSIVHLQVGRAYAISGDSARAREAYQDFFALWKEADPDTPILKRAKAEYAHLQ